MTRFSLSVSLLLTISTVGVLSRPQDLEASDGCGPNPLSVVIAAASELDGMTATEVMAMVESDRDTWGEVLSRIHAYDDCVRAGQLRFKRLPSPPYITAKEASPRKPFGSLKPNLALSSPQTFSFNLATPLKTTPTQTFLQHLLQQTKDVANPRHFFAQ